MIARAHRFHGYGSLKFVYQNGKTVRGSLMALKFAPNPRRASYRLAVVVSKKVHKSAVIRNRIRRRIYEAVRTQINDQQPYDLVLTVFSEKVVDMKGPELAKEIGQQLKQVDPKLLR